MLVIGAGARWHSSAVTLRRRPNCRDMDGKPRAGAGLDAGLAAMPKASSCWRPATRSATALPAWLIGKLGRDGFEMLPAVSTLQIAFARFRKAWQDIKIASCHTADAGEWFVGATPAHGLYPLMRAIALNRRVALFTSPDNNPARLARALMAAGYGDEVKLSIASRLLLPDEAVFTDLLRSTRKSPISRA
jgi:precorrin-6Y C5,15-methyltransferase (decarboxylating)